jgi:hypothetical protein
MRYLRLTERKTHQEISDILRKRYPGIKGLSVISVGRFCVKNGIRTRKTVAEIEMEKKASKYESQVYTNKNFYSSLCLVFMI